MTTLTTEKLLTSPKAFGLTTASPLQRAICRALDGLPIGELGALPQVREAFGGVLPEPAESPPLEVHIVAATRSAKSLTSAAAIVRWSQTVEVAGLGRGDIIRIPVVSIKLENARAVMNHLVEYITAQPLLRKILVGEPLASCIHLRHPSGRIIEVTPAPLDRAGGSMIGVWLAGAVFDEEPRMLGAEDGQRNWNHSHTAAIGRLLPGAQFLGIGSPWAPFGPIYDLVQEHWGRPSRDMLIVRAKGPDMNPFWWTPARCAHLAKTDPVAYRTDVLAEFADPETGLFSSGELDTVTRKAPLERAPEPERYRYRAAIDPAYRRNAFTLVIGHRERAKVVIDVARQWVPGLERLKPRQVFEEIADVVKPYRINRLRTDQHNTDTNAEIARAFGLSLEERTAQGNDRVELYDELLAGARDQRLELPPDPFVRSDLLSIRVRITQQKKTIVLPTTADGRHADYAPALVLLNEDLRGGISARAFQHYATFMQRMRGIAHPA